MNSEIRETFFTNLNKLLDKSSTFFKSLTAPLHFAIVQQLNEWNGREIESFFRVYFQYLRDGIIKIAQTEFPESSYLMTDSEQMTWNDQEPLSLKKLRAWVETVTCVLIEFMFNMMEQRVITNGMERFFIILYQLELLSKLLVENMCDFTTTVDTVIIHTLSRFMNEWRYNHPDSLIVMTWNLPGSKKTTKDMIETKFKKEHVQFIEMVDVAFLQEFATGEGESGACEKFVNRFEKLTRYSVQNLKRHNRKEQDYGVILWNEKYYPCEEEYCFQGMESLNPTLINVHLSFTNSQHRNEEFEELKSYIKKRLKRTSFIIAGDFNFEVTSDRFDGYFEDIVNCDNCELATTKAGRKIDHVIFSRDFECAFSIVPQLLAFPESNHYPKIVFLTKVEESDDDDDESDDDHNKDIAVVEEEDDDSFISSRLEHGLNLNE
ncbi:hypothetical protein C9374_011345 [Naegleria lovaniensis]|uniref:Endonuclease/exonuclease/phosphatase domain-containing protein n=1 Tax=Naegleria lovaniensis TaxID=51637 RepID=A0AA88KWL3_NAELO|nr:uncharacterized protein C9374_011345 [Naegleria lovaniensis]KAG2392620.1 hypothetical protein C9374_011345 [Naegleria lovaniensis]